MSNAIDLNRLGLRTITREGAPWYFLSDVTAALGFAPTGVTIMSRSLPEAEVSTIEVPAYPATRRGSLSARRGYSAS
jgi:prophage antirepressor-like protein